MENHIGEQLNDLNAYLNEIGKALEVCYSNDNSKPPHLTNVVQVALKEVRRHLNSQVACLFGVAESRYESDRNRNFPKLEIVD
jgi:hypothetical protein